MRYFLNFGSKPILECIRIKNSKDPQNLNSYKQDLQVILKKLQVPPLDSPENVMDTILRQSLKKYRYHRHIDLNTLQISTTAPSPRKKGKGTTTRYPFKSYKYYVSIAFGKFEVPCSDSPQKMAGVISRWHSKNCRCDIEVTSKK